MFVDVGISRVDRLCDSILKLMDAGGGSVGFDVLSDARRV